MGLTQDLDLLHEQDEDWEDGDSAGHADAENKLPRVSLRADPATAQGQR
jgi:hypothetical protein